ncbi:hypothetical protein OG788_04310 [Streptomyces sp. NBC_00647]|uniref:hypothetical protein n=1 Tax=Streptomyces sp. NBC_00647 TaxID=2975796 RepID=UPI0032520138
MRPARGSVLDGAFRRGLAPVVLLVARQPRGLPGAAARLVAPLLAASRHLVHGARQLALW